MLTDSESPSSRSERHREIVELFRKATPQQKQRAFELVLQRIATRLRMQIAVSEVKVPWRDTCQNITQ